MAAKSKLNAPLRVMTKKGTKKRIAINESLIWGVEEDNGRTIVYPAVEGVRPIEIEEDFDTVVSRLNTFVR